MDTQKQITIGLGQIGQAVQKVLNSEGYDTKTEKPFPDGPFDVLHVCFPFSNTFLDQVKFYQELYNPKLTVIHSTVPIGTSREVKAVHSPVRGIHPDLEMGVRTFVKFFGGEDALEAAELFEKCGVECVTSPRSEDTEAMKLFDTMQYGVSIALQKEIHDFCEAHDLDFDIVYTLANRSYNTGYTALGHPEFTKYVLRNHPGKIGGHCVIQNCHLIDTPTAKRIIQENETF